MINQELIERMDTAIARMEPSIHKDNLIAKRWHVSSSSIEIVPIQVHESLSTDIARQIPKSLLNTKGGRLKNARSKK